MRTASSCAGSCGAAIALGGHLAGKYSVGPLTFGSGIAASALVAAAELVVLVLVLAALRVVAVQRRRQAPSGTLYTAGVGVASRDLARYGALQASPAGFDLFRRPVPVYGGHLTVTRDVLNWKPDAYSTRHGARPLMIPVPAVVWSSVAPRAFGLGCLAEFGLADGWRVRLVARGRATRLRRGLARAGVPSPPSAPA